MNMDASSEHSQPAKRSRNAKRSSRACLGCKRTKRRCDISQQPPNSQGCTNCAEKGAYCQLQYGEDRRRKRSGQPDTDIEHRLALLEELLSQSQRDIDRRLDEMESLNTGDAAEPSIDVHAGPPPSGTNRDRPMDISMLRTASSASDTIEVQTTRPRVQRRQSQTPWSGPERSNLAPTSALRRPVVVAKNHNSPGNSSTTSIMTSQLGDSGSILERVVSREGALEGPDPNNVRYFGATSIYHLSSTTGASDFCRSKSQSNSSASVPWADIPPENDPSNEPEALVLYLIDLFCAWQASHLQIIHRDQFLEEKKLYDNDKFRRRYQFFSPSLLYAIMAIASLVSLDRGTRYHSTVPGQFPGSVYLNKAKKLFELEMDDPAITTVQTALLIGSHYGAVGFQSPGWTYSGIALRMAVELGLHISCDAAVIHGQVSHEVANLRKVVFWGCYVQDKLWSAYCGRPSFIMDWDITVSRPEKPPCTEGTTDKAAIQAAVHWNIVFLTIKNSQILSELYSQKYSGNQRQLGASAASIHGDLLKWHDELSTALKWPNESGSPVSPHVLLMHMHFYFTLCLLHRPFIDFGQDVASTNQLEGGPPSPVTICSLAATNITKLSRDYSLYFNLRQIPSPAIHFIFIAATIHLINHRVAGDGSHEPLFQGCLSSLADIGQSYPNGKKAVSVLQELAGKLRPSGGLGDSNVHSQVNSRAHRRASEARSLPLTARIVLNAENTNTSGHGVPSTSAYDSAQTRQDNMRSGLGNIDSLDWATDLGNFDWSNLSSPIALPPDLDNIDLNLCRRTSPHLYATSNAFPMDLWPAVPTPSIENTETFASGTNDVMDAETGGDSSLTFLGRYYGTAFGLG